MIINKIFSSNSFFVYNNLTDFHILILQPSISCTDCISFSVEFFEVSVIMSSANSDSFIPFNLDSFYIFLLRNYSSWDFQLYIEK